MRKRIFKGFAAVLLSSTLTVSTVFAVFADDVDKLKQQKQQTRRFTRYTVMRCVRYFLISEKALYFSENLKICI